MARMTPQTNRFDPYRTFRFKVKWDGQYVAGLNKCGALKRTTEVTPWYEGGDSSGPHQIPGKTKYDAITMEAGITHDTAFEDWANKINNFQGDAAMGFWGWPLRMSDPAERAARAALAIWRRFTRAAGQRV